jgi:hypothetical protein
MEDFPDNQHDNFMDDDTEEKLFLANFSRKLLEIFYLCKVPQSTFSKILSFFREMAVLSQESTRRRMEKNQTDGSQTLIEIGSLQNRLGNYIAKSWKNYFFQLLSFFRKRLLARLLVIFLQDRKDVA